MRKGERGKNVLERETWKKEEGREMGDDMMRKKNIR
jgi:hypothetical protein